VKLEPEPTLIPEVLKITLPPSPHHDWRHPDELPYIRGGDSWDDVTILQFLTDNAFTIPPRSASSAEPWVRIGRGVSNREPVVLPRLYRTPLLWVAKFQWKSLELVLTADASIRQQEWDARKWDVLHIARLCVSLLDGARDAMAVESGGGMTRAWRHPPFDRALTRYWHRWLVLRDEFVRDFWRDYGEEEYRRDILKLGAILLTRPIQIFTQKPPRMEAMGPQRPQGILAHQRGDPERNRGSGVHRWTSRRL
jgi:hypothetical protein